MNSELSRVLEGLAGAIDLTGLDLDTDHGRWRLYERAIETATASGLLYRAVALEEDEALAASVVLRMLELVPDDQQGRWIKQLSPDNQAYSQRRAEEIKILRRVRVGELHGADLSSEIDSWSDWLQLRLAHEIEDRSTAAILSTKGRTRRIRNTAMDRLRTLGGSCP